MATDKRVVILGGHGKVALLAAPKLVAAGFSVDAVIRNPEQDDDIRAAGGNPVVLDIESADVDDLASLFDGAAAVVFAAGAGGGNPKRTNAVDYRAAVRAVDAASRTQVPQFVIVSYATVGVDPERVDPKDSFYPYVEAKHAADAHLRSSDLDFTILGPGRLTLEPAGGITVADEQGRVDGEFPGEGQNDTSRETVAAVIAYVISHGAAKRRTINFYDGATPIADAIG